MPTLSRRALLALTAGGAAATLVHAAPPSRIPSGLPPGLPSGVPWGAPTRPRRRRKAVKLYMVGEKKAATLTDKFALLKELGFDGVDLDSPTRDYGTDDVLAAKKATGLDVVGTVDSVHWKDTLSHSDPAARARGVAALGQAIADCKAWGGTTCLLVPAVVNKGVSYRDAWDRCVPLIKEVLPHAQQHGVRIAIENVWNNFLLSPLEMARFIDQFESPWIGAHLDPGNLVKFGWPEHWIEVLGKRILKVDVKAFNRGKSTFKATLADKDDDTDWPAVITALDKVGYDGWYIAEMDAGDRAWLADVSKRMDGFLVAPADAGAGK